MKSFLFCFFVLIFAAFADLSVGVCCGPADDKVGTDFCKEYLEASPESRKELQRIWGEECEGCTFSFCYTKENTEDKRKFFRADKRKFRRQERKFFRAVRADEDWLPLATPVDLDEEDLAHLVEEKRKFFRKGGKRDEISEEKRKFFRKGGKREEHELSEEKRKFFRKGGKRDEISEEKRKFFRKGGKRVEDEFSEEKRKFFRHGGKRDELSDEVGKRGKPNAFRFRRGKPNAFRFRRSSAEEEKREDKRKFFRKAG